MAEKLNPSQIQGQIRQIIKDKAWYGYNPETQAFDWGKSLQALSESLDFIDPQTLGLVIESCYTPNCLTQVTIVDPQTEEKRTQPLIRALVENGFQITVWTVGDSQWQRRKFELAGLTYLENQGSITFNCSSRDKINTLKEILDNKPDDNFIVVDDKRETIDQVASIQSQYKNLIFQYHMKLNDPQANPNSFFNWLRRETTNLGLTSQQVHLILDFDGVIADTDNVLFDPVVERLAKIKESGIFTNWSIYSNVQLPNVEGVELTFITPQPRLDIRTRILRIIDRISDKHLIPIRIALTFLEQGILTDSFEESHPKRAAFYQNNQVVLSDGTTITLDKLNEIASKLRLNSLFSLGLAYKNAEFNFLTQEELNKLNQNIRPKKGYFVSEDLQPFNQFAERIIDEILRQYEEQ